MVPLEFNSMRFRANLPSVFGLCFAFLLLGSTPSFAQSNTAEVGAPKAQPETRPETRPEAQPETLFLSGLEAVQKSDLKQARESFTAALKQQPGNPILLFNLGYIEHKSGHEGLAIALWRKALAMRPGFHQAADAVRWSTARLDPREISHESELWESFRASFLVGESLNAFLIGTALALAASGWVLLRYAGRRRRARLADEPMPRFPLVGGLSAACLVLFTVLAVSKAYDQQVIRGTIVEKKIAVRSAPDSSATVLFELYEGLEVIVLREQNEWTQVNYPGGATGWLPQAAVFATTETVVP